MSLDDGKPTRSVVRIEEVARLPIIREIAGDTVVYGFRNMVEPAVGSL
jgi:hypothetical protein